MTTEEVQYRMEFAIVLARVEHRSALSAGPLDVERLLELSRRGRVEVFADEMTRGSEALRREGLRVHIAPRRWITGPDHRRRSSDALQARALLQRHDQRPFDGIVYGSELTADLAHYEPQLKALPRGSALGAGVGQDARRIWQDPALFARLGMRLWGQTGHLSTADFVLADAPPEAFDLSADMLPPFFSPTPLVDGGRDTSGGQPAPDLVCVAATTCGPEDLDDLAERLTERVEIQSSTTIAVVIRERENCDDGRRITEACGDALGRQLIVVQAGDDGVAESFLGRARQLVLATPREVVVPAVAAAAQTVPTLVLGSQDPPKPPPPLDSGVLAQISNEARHCSVQFLEWRAAELADELRAATQVADDTEPQLDGFIVLHAPGTRPPAVDLVGRRAPNRADLVIWCPGAPLYGEPDPSHILPTALALSSRCAARLADEIATFPDPWTFLYWALDASRMHRLRLLTLPAPEGAACVPVARAEQRDFGWRPAAGLLPPARYQLHSEAARPSSQPAAETFLPRQRMQPPKRASDDPTLEDWVRSSPWKRRALLSLPWRGGLLGRALRGMIDE